MKKQRIFIASSSGALLYAQQLAELLKQEKNLYPVVWNESGAVFELGKTYIESLEDALYDFDIAIVIFHPDDSGKIKGEKTHFTRDNVVFEYGLFFGRLGREKCYVVYPNNLDLRIPSDLMGMHNAPYEYLDTKNAETVKSLMSNAAKMIISRIGEVSHEKRTPPANIQVIGSHLHLATTQRKIFNQLLNCIREGITLPEEILYWSVTSANAWLNYEQETFQNANGALALLARYIDDNTKDENLQFISIGCGSGDKDILIMNSLSPDERLVSYFPIDQSYTLLENAITETLSNINAEEIFVNGIRADFRKIPSFQHIFKRKNTRAIYSFLGCTLGNYDEVTLLNAICSCMETGDYLILEVGQLDDELVSAKNGEPINSGKYKDRKLQDFLLSAVKPFVKDAPRDCLSFVKDAENCNVNKSIRVIVKFDNKDLPDQSPFDIAFSTHYDKDELIKYLKDIHELDTVYSDIQKKNIYLVCQKP